MILTEQSAGGKVDICPVPQADNGKVNLKWIANQYEIHGFPMTGSITKESLRERYRGNPELQAIDLYALGVPVVRDIVATAVGMRPERQPHGLVNRLKKGYGPVEYFRSSDPYGQLRENMGATLTLASDNYFDDDSLQKRMETNPHAQHNLDAFNLLATDHSGSAKAFLQQGIDTATNVMPSTLRLVPDLFRQQFHSQPDSDTATQIAVDNYPFLSRLAVAHLISFVDLTDMVGGRNKKPFNPSAYEYKENEKYIGGWELKFTDETQHKFVLAFGRKLQDPVEGARIRLGCIAAHSGALRSLWDWQTDIAGETIYPQQLWNNEFTQLSLPQNPRVVFSA